MRHDHDPLLCFHDRHLGYHLKLDAKCSVQLCTRSQDELFALHCAGLLWSLRCAALVFFGCSAALRWSSLVAPLRCAGLLWSLRCAARRPAAQGRVPFCAFTARLKPCPDTCPHGGYEVAVSLGTGPALIGTP